MKKRASPIFVAGFLFIAIFPGHGILSAQEGFPLERALRPLEEGVPEVAVVRLRAFLATRPSAGERAIATARLGEALVASGRAEEALKVLEDAAVLQTPAGKFHRAQALAVLGRWAEALVLYQQCATEAPFRSEALFGQAESLRGLGRGDEALQVLQSLTNDPQWGVRAKMRAVELLIDKKDTAGATRLLDSVENPSLPEKKERRFLRGRIAAAEGRPKQAAQLYRSILKSPEGAPHSVLVADIFAIADVYLGLGTPEKGDDLLEEFIDRYPNDPNLGAVFLKLDQLYASERKQARHELPGWSRDPAQPRRALAQWYLAKAEVRLGRPEVAAQVLEQLRREQPPVRELTDALFDYAKLEAERGRFEQAAAIAEEARSLTPRADLLQRINFLLARVQYRAGRHQLAAQTFRKIADEASPFAREALFDASLAWLEANEPRQAAATTQQLKERGGDEETSADLLLEQGLMQAAKGEPGASASLEKFVRDFPKHPRAAEAWVALAELAFQATPPAIDDARQKLERALQSQPGEAAIERADYLRIWLEESASASQPNENKVLELASQFLQKHPGSALLPEVRLKLAEIHFQRQDFANAETHFATLAQNAGNPALAEKGQYFAAESAMKTMGAASLERALGLFGEVVKKNGDLKWAARNQQAVIERKLGKTQDAITLYDEVLKSDARPAEKLEALCGKADILYDLGSKERENYKRALELYTQLATHPDASPHWRNQALFKKGACQEKLTAPEEALATFYQVIETENRPEPQREFFWFYKAGFNAARLLEEQAKWPAAAAIYEKLAFAGGARSDEAKARLNKLRLEHFLWEQ